MLCHFNVSSKDIGIFSKVLPLFWSNTPKISSTLSKKKPHLVELRNKCFTLLIGALFFAASILYSASSCHFLKSSTRKRSSYCGLSGGFISVSRMDVKREVCRLVDCNGSIASPDVSIISADSSSHFLPCSIRATKSRYGTPSTHSSRGKFFS